MTKLQIREYCDAEFENLDLVLSELFNVVIAGKEDYSISELAAIAVFIHNFYNSVENIIKRILIFKGINIKNSSTWHKDLLTTALQYELISEKIINKLIIYLSFRHFFIHAYVISLKWLEIKPLVENIKEVVENFKSEICCFLDNS